MSAQETKEMQELITILNDSVDFYREARQKVKSTELKATFEEIASIKQQLINQLQPLVIQREGEPEDGHSVAVKVRQLYTNVLASMQKDKSDTFISNLEEVEDKTRAKARRALDVADTTDVVVALRQAYPQIKKCHDEMSRLKTAQGR
ncbi:MAG TPA: PA2169 family four-helix-bundle protein [Dongiaceae bacterium]|nr:PA2169 family four-helix-bundle protein [Dongiaceae bacterium]